MSRSKRRTDKRKMVGKRGREQEQEKDTLAEYSNNSQHNNNKRRLRRVYLEEVPDGHAKQRRDEEWTGKIYKHRGTNIGIHMRKKRHKEKGRRRCREKTINYE